MTEPIISSVMLEGDKTKPKRDCVMVRSLDVREMLFKGQYGIIAQEICFIHQFKVGSELRVFTYYPLTNFMTYFTAYCEKSNLEFSIKVGKSPSEEIRENNELVGYQTVFTKE